MTDGRLGRVAAAAVVLCLALGGCGAPEAPAESEPRERSRHLLIVLDGLRPDYVTPELMPNLHALGARGVVFTRHHAVYPTVTRVNAASISTGAYPETHGLLGNSAFFPEVDPAQFLSTGERDNLLRIERAEGGRLLTAATLGERLQDAGLRLLVASAGTTGSSYLLNHTVAGGGIIHYDYALPEALGAAVQQRFGPPPPAATPNRARNRYIVDALLDVGLEQVDPAVIILWLSDPDTTAHAHGVGHPTAVAALRAVDEELARIEARLLADGLLERFNIWVTSDHGFSTHTPRVDIAALLAPFQGETETGAPRVVTGSDAIYVREGGPEAVAGIVRALQANPRVGAVFTRDGHAPGTLAFSDARWDHPRSADILYSPAWSDAENVWGYRGQAASYGVAGHGSASPFDIHNTLIAAGPDLRTGIDVALPTSNIDLAPTFLYLLGLIAAPTMTGRVLTTALVDGPDVSPDQRSAELTAETPDGRYRATARLSIAFDRRYLDSATAERSP